MVNVKKKINLPYLVCLYGLASRFPNPTYLFELQWLIDDY